MRYNRHADKQNPRVGVDLNRDPVTRLGRFSYDFGYDREELS